MRVLSARRKGTLLFLAGAALVAGAGGVAYASHVTEASIPDGNGVIHGCYNGKGHLRVVDTDAGKTCHVGETALTWNQQGPQGATGPAGPAGPAGATGPQGATG